LEGAVEHQSVAKKVRVLVLFLLGIGFLLSAFGGAIRAERDVDLRWAYAGLGVLYGAFIVASARPDPLMGDGRVMPIISIGCVVAGLCLLLSGAGFAGEHNGGTEARPLKLVLGVALWIVASVIARVWWPTTNR
jgi:peptidoglycan/LPS O-acetylase OafA/YrhL